MSDIHLCNWSQQPDVQIACDGSWTTPAIRFQKAEQAATGIKDVHKADDGRLYTFDRRNVTCPKCKSV